MNHSEERLTSAFKDLAAEAPPGAPVELGRQIKDLFREHHTRRRRMRVLASGLAAAACLATIGLFLLKGNSVLTKQPPNPPSPEARDSTNPSGQPGSGTPKEDEPGRPVLPGRRGPKKHLAAYRQGDITASPSPAIARGFTPLPTYDPAVPAEGYHIVRVGLQDTALSQLGMPVHENASGERVVADLLLDRDGLPLAVRFVTGQKTK